jgi:hypothetical protein
VATPTLDGVPATAARYERTERARPHQAKTIRFRYHSHVGFYRQLIESGISAQHE